MFRLKHTIIAALLAVGSLLAQQTTGTLKGVLTDNSGAVIPAATVMVIGGATQKAAQTQADGSFSMVGLALGQYTVRVAYPGFGLFEQTINVDAGTLTLPIQLTVTAEKQEVTVKGEPGPMVSVEPDNNATALVLKGEDLAALPDDPDDLADALQALAGPGAGPNGGSIYIDGFSGGQLPPKESIREIRINQNPFSAEFDRLGFGRIEILTRPGTDRFRGSIGYNDSEGVFNARNPFDLSPTRPAFSNRMVSGNIGGPINKKSSFFLDVNRRMITDNALVNATYLDPRSLLQQNIQTAVVTPNTRTTVAPRIDYQLSKNNTIVGRFEYGWNEHDNVGVGGTRLPPPYADMAYVATGNQANLMLTETSVINNRMVNETRFQFSSNSTHQTGNLLPQINVSGAFTSGGNEMGLNFNRRAHYELQNLTTISHHSHTIRFGVRARREGYINDSPQDFGGTFSFDGVIAPVLDANNLPIAGQTAQITSIEQYRRTLLFQGLGYSPDQIRALGGMPSQFTIQAGNPYGSVRIWDVAPWVLDDWRVKPNFTLSLGLRYEWQADVHDNRDIAPRIGFAWAPGTAKNGRQKTVIRGGFGLFYDRVGYQTFLNAEELNGTRQLNYSLTNPNFFPTIPALSTLTASQNSIDLIDPRLRAAYLMQSAIGVERQLPHNTTVAATFTDTRGLHSMQTIPINTPFPGTFIPGVTGSGLRPYGNAGNLFEYESGGLMKQTIWMVNVNTQFRRNLSLQSNYSYNTANDLPGTPTNPYNFNDDWGRSAFEHKHRLSLIGSFLAPGKVRLSPLVTVQSGAPYDLTVGRDLFGDTLKNVRPSFATSPNDPDTVCRAGLGCFNTNPLLDGPFVPRDYLTGAGMVSINVRASRTIGFGAPRRGNNAMQPGGGGDGMGGGPNGGGRGGFGGGGRGGPGGGGPGGGGARGGGGMRMGGGGRGGRAGGDTTEHRYNVTFSVSVNNIMNHVNPGAYSGLISSPKFGLPQNVVTGYGGGGAGGTQANNRRVDLSMRFSF